MNRQRVWVPPGRSADVEGQTIPGGMLYIGRSLRSGVGTIEPALINPALPLDRGARRAAPRDLPPSMSYHLLSAADRSSYLDWLATGREQVGAPIGFVRLFFAGLERRVLLDRGDDPTVAGELPAIAAEVHRLRERYGPISRSFETAAEAFVQVLDLLTAPARPAVLPAEPASGPGPDRSPVPLALRLALAQFALSGRPVPAGWARWWAWYHPALFPTAPQTRCPDEFDTLFALRYQARTGSGVIPATADRPAVRCGYRPVNPGLDPTVTERLDLPDVLEEAPARRELSALIDSVTDALTPYSRWLGRHPEGAGTTASSMLLPDDLIASGSGPLQRLVSWSNARLANLSTTVIDGRDFGPFWATADPGRMSREESESLLTVLSRIGLGVEPDVRFGGTVLGPGPVVLFRLDPAAKSPTSPGYPLALTVLDLAAAAILPASTGRLDDVVNLTVTALATWIPLTVGERSRLSARLRWLIALNFSLTTGTAARRLRRQVAGLGAPERETAGQALLAVTGAVSTGSDELFPSATVQSLVTAYRVIGLPTDLLFRRLHHYGLSAPDVDAPNVDAPNVDAPDVDAPVIVRAARPEPTGFRLPRKSASPPAPAVPSAATVESAGRPGGPIRLRPSVITRTMAQSATVSRLLSDIFVDAGAAVDEGAAITAPAPLAAAEPLPGTLISELLTRSIWSPTDFAEVVGRHNLLPDSALDIINEMTIELTGEPAIEGDDELAVNHEVLREILGDGGDAG